jgi:two-component system phosphate regulon sensor histidine kinase PhoR
MSSYRSRLIIPLTIIIFLVFAGIGAVFGPLFKEFYLERVNDRLSKEAEVAALYLDRTELSDTENVEESINQLASRLDLRISVVGLDGTVVADSEGEPGQMENHLDRPEIQNAAEHGSGFEIRYSNTLNNELIYYAVPYVQQGETVAYLRFAMSIQEFNHVYRSIWVILAVCFFLAFLIIVFVAAKLANQLTEPIDDARKTAIQLAKGNYAARAYTGNSKEAGQLNQSLNVLAENLDQITKTYENQQERLKALIENMGSGLLLIDEKGYITLVNQSCKDIFREDTDEWLNKLYYQAVKYKEVIKVVQEILLTETKTRKQAALHMDIETRHVDIHAAPVIGQDDKLKGVVLVFHDITELIKLEQTRKDFVANVSHELKTPVTSIKGFTETLIDGAMEDPALRERFLTIIAKESERLESLIYDLFELSKIEQERFLLNWEPVELSALAEDVIFMLSEKAAQKNIQLENKVKGNTLIEGDPFRLKQILINLINNAITYTPDGGTVCVQTKEQAETVVLKVKDTGIGINKKELPRIFERFYRVDRARSRNSGGTGLGLAIVKHLVDAHKGRITVESKAGKGSSFQISFYKNKPED